MAQNAGARTYRPDIDGLRALSVVAVVLYHASPEILPGGFLGVDVFFVISGFLIGGMLIEEIASGEFRFRNFYLRRARRLLPALSVVLVATTVVACLVYSPEQLGAVGVNSVASMFGWANVRYSFQDPYAAVESGINPLLHTWSLGVEEQFYLLIPALLWLLSRLRGQRTMGLVLAGSLTASFAASMILGHLVSAQRHFFLISSRAWEMLAGVLLAAMLPGLVVRMSTRTRATLVGCGLVAVVASFVALEGLADGPGPMTLVPIVGTVGVIAGGPTNRVSDRLSTRLPVWLGLVSYPLYLWHYPLLALWSVGPGRDGVPERLGVVAIALCLSHLTLTLVERPIRRSGSRRVWIPALVSLVLVAGAFSGIVVASGGLPQRLDDMPAVESREPVYGQNTVAAGDGPGVLVVGDSHMIEIATSLARLPELRGETIVEWVEPGCQFLIGIERARRKDGLVDKCTVDLQADRLDWIDSFPGSTVVVGGRLPLFVEGDRFDNEEGGDEGDFTDYLREPGTQTYDPDLSRSQIARSLQRTVGALEAAGHRVVLVYPIPEVGVNVPAALAQRTMLNIFRWPIDTPLTTSYEVYVRRTARSFAMLDDSGSDSTIRVYPHELFCNNPVAGRCVTHSDAAIYYEDLHHLSRAGADRLAEDMRGIFTTDG